MTNWEDFDLVFDNLIRYFTGDTTFLSILIIGVFLIVLTSRGIKFKHSIIITLPLLGFFVAIGWFEAIVNPGWLVNFALIIVSFIYGFAILRLTT